MDNMEEEERKERNEHKQQNVVCYLSVLVHNKKKRKGSQITCPIDEWTHTHK